MLLKLIRYVDKVLDSYSANARQLTDYERGHRDALIGVTRAITIIVKQGDATWKP